MGSEFVVAVVIVVVVVLLLFFAMFLLTKGDREVGWDDWKLAGPEQQAGKVQVLEGMLSSWGQGDRAVHRCWLCSADAAERRGPFG